MPQNTKRKTYHYIIACVCYVVVFEMHITLSSRGPPASILVTLNAGRGGEFPSEGLTDTLQMTANNAAASFGINVTGVQRFGRFIGLIKRAC